MTDHRPSPPAPTGIPVSLPAREAVLAGFEGRFVEAQYVWTSFLLEHLIACRRRIGDLDTLLVLTVIGLAALREVQRLREREGAPIPLGYLTAGLPDRGGAVNAYSIAGITGIPRENVRRRLAALARQGWIEQLPDGGWRIRTIAEGPPPVATDLADLTAGTVERIADFIGRLATISASAAAEATATEAAAGPPG